MVIQILTNIIKCYYVYLSSWTGLNRGNDLKFLLDHNKRRHIHRSQTSWLSSDQWKGQWKNIIPKWTEQIILNKWCLDLIVTHKIRSKWNVSSIFKTTTMIYSILGWFEIIKYDQNKSIIINNFVKLMWIARYLHILDITHDQGS